MGPAKLLINPLQFRLTLDRLAHQLVEEHGDFSESALIGIQPRGIHLACAIGRHGLKKFLEVCVPAAASWTSRSFRDDFRRQRISRSVQL